VSRGAPIATLYATDYAEVRLPIPDRELAFVDLPLAYRPDGPNGPNGPDGPEGPDLPGDGTGTLDAVGSVGPSVRLRAEFAGGQHAWSGRIVRTEGEIDPKSRMIHAVARVEDPYAREAGSDRPPLAVGLFVEAEIQGRRVERAVVLPRAALRRQEASPGAAAADGHFVLVVDHESRLEFRSVEVLRTEREEVVIGAGLQAGERVCVSPLRAAVEGMTVRVAGDDSGRLATTHPAGEDAAEARP
jgi:hypothetical protein